MRKSVGTRAETSVHEHTNTCPPNLSDKRLETGCVAGFWSSWKFMALYFLSLLSVVSYVSFFGFCVMFSWVAHIQVLEACKAAKAARIDLSYWWGKVLAPELRQAPMSTQTLALQIWVTKDLRRACMCGWFLKFMALYFLSLLSVVSFCGFCVMFSWVARIQVLEACKAAKAARIDLSHWWGKVLAPELRQASMSTQTLALQIWVTKDLRRDVLLVSEVHGSSWHFTFCRCFLWFLMFLSLAFVSCFLEWHTSK